MPYPREPKYIKARTFFIPSQAGVHEINFEDLGEQESMELLISPDAYLILSQFVNDLDTTKWIDLISTFDLIRAGIPGNVGNVHYKCLFFHSPHIMAFDGEVLGLTWRAGRNSDIPVVLTTEERLLEVEYEAAKLNVEREWLQ